MVESKLIPQPHGLPEQGGIFWFAGGVPDRSLPKPCVACLDFLAELGEDELKQLIRRVRARAEAQKANDPHSRHQTQ